MKRIRTERVTARSFPGELGNLSNYKDSGEYEDNKDGSNKKGNNHGSTKEESVKEIDEVDKLLEELKRNEPTSDNPLFRLSIIAYEIGDLHRAIVYAERFKNDEKIRVGHLANGKLALADVLTQLYLLCVSMGWDFHKLRKLGAEHLAERYVDFKRDGWSEIR